MALSPRAANTSMAAADERLDDSHVRNGIMNRRRDISIRKDSSRKEIRLDPILIANVELNAIDDAICLQ